MNDPDDDIDDAAYDYTIGMTDDELEERLRAESIGVLSLADGGESYAIPVAYHYDEETVFIRLGLHPNSRKADMIEMTDTACFLLYGAEPIDASWSIIATGTLRQIEDSSQFSDEVINSLFVPLRVFGECVEEIDQTVFALDIDSISGRRAAGV